MEPVAPTELRTAARVSDGLVYVAGMAGVVAGALLFREGNLPFAIIAWVVTFIAGAVLRLASWAARGIAQLMERTERMEADLQRLSRESVAGEDVERPPWGSWH